MQKYVLTLLIALSSILHARTQDCVALVDIIQNPNKISVEFTELRTKLRELNIDLSDYMAIKNTFSQITDKELIENGSKILKSSDTFELAPTEFLARLGSSQYSIKEYYKRVDTFRNHKSLIKKIDEATRVLLQKEFWSPSNLKLLHQKVIDLLPKSLQKIKSVINKPDELIKYISKLRLEDQMSIAQTIKEVVRVAKNKFLKNAIKTRKINAPNFFRTTAIFLAVDNGSLFRETLRDATKRLVEVNVNNLSYDLGIFSIIEIILMKTTIKEAAFLEANPKYLKLLGEAAEKLADDATEELKGLALLKAKLARVPKLAKQKTGIFFKEGTQLGTTTFSISLIAGFIMKSLDPSIELATAAFDSFTNAALVGAFFSTSTHVRYVLLHKGLRPLLRKVPYINNAKLEPFLVTALAIGNMTIGSKHWIWYRKKLDYLLGKEVEDNSQLNQEE